MAIAMLIDVAAAIAAACRATGVADAAGINQTEWTSAWASGGHVRPWRPSRVQRGRATYLEYRVRDADFTDRSNEGGTATIHVDVACIVRASGHGAVEDKSAAVLLTALDAFRLIPGAICGANDTLGEAVAVPGFSDVWRREATVTLDLSYGEGQRGGPVGTVSIPPIGTPATGLVPPGIVTTVAFNEAGSPRSILTIPVGTVVDHVVVIITETWNGVGASLTVGADLDPSSILILTLAADLAVGESYRVAVPLVGVGIVKIAWAPGAGATTGRATVQVATAPE